MERDELPGRCRDYVLGEVLEGLARKVKSEERKD
jgi:hypothetical protein